MSGTKEGGQKIRESNLAKDPDYYVNLGKLGGSAPHTVKGGYGSEKIGTDGLTGFERTRKLAEERKKRVGT